MFGQLFPGLLGIGLNKPYLTSARTLPWLGILAVAALTVIASLTLYTIAVLEYPFDDTARVGPDAF
jgi:hypothetical protein